MRRLDQAHAIFLRRLQEDFCDAITGKSIDFLDDGEHPQKHFLVGMLSPQNDEENLSDSSSVTVHQLGMDLLFAKDDLEHTLVDVRLTGHLFYRVRPSLEQQRKAFAREAFNKKIIERNDFSQLATCDAIKRAKLSIPLLAVYHKISLENIIETPLSICIGDCFSPSSGCGELPANHQVVAYLDSCLQKAKETVSGLTETYKKTAEPVCYTDLIDENSWEVFNQRA